MMMLDWMKEAKSIAEDPLNGFDPGMVISSDPIEIAAPAQTVWDILTDMPSYSAWNPFCIRAESTLEMGAPVMMTLVNYTMPGELAPNCEFVCAKEEPHLLSWQLPWSEEWPYSARRDQVIESTGAVSCIYTSLDAFQGESAVHVMRFCGPWVKRAFDDSARALKIRAETLYGEAND